MAVAKSFSDSVVRPYGDLQAINDLSKLFSEQKDKGELLGYSFLISPDTSLTAGDIAKEINDVYRDHLAGNTIDITDEVLSGCY